VTKRVEKELKDRLFDKLLGGGDKEAAPVESDSVEGDTTEGAPAEEAPEEKSPEDVLKDKLKDRLKGLID
jgi:hypothetical protein